jgi:hypothetical protein
MLGRDLLDGAVPIHHDKVNRQPRPGHRIKKGPASRGEYGKSHMR